MSIEKEAQLELKKILEEWTSTALGRRAFLKALPFLLASCASVERSRYREGDNRGQRVSLTPRQEKEMADEVLPSMTKEYPPLKDARLQKYISELGTQVVVANGLQKNPYNYSFQVVDSPQINAFALPAGRVFVTTPLLAMCDTEAELAGVIGHEVGHVKARHTAERIYKEERKRGKSIGYLIGGGLIGGLLGYGLSRVICRKRDRECIARTTQLGALAGVGGGVLITKFAFMANSREDELEADRIGFKSAVKAGFSKDHVGNFYEKLLAMEQSKGRSRGVLAFTDALSTHPPSRERVVQMYQMASETLGKGKVSSEKFDQMRVWAVEKVT